MSSFVNFYIGGVTCTVLSIVGLLINGYAIFTLIKQHLTAIFHKLMLSLVLFDFFYVLFLLLCYSLPKLSSYYQDYIIIYALPFFVPLTQIFLSGSGYMTVALTVERFISVCRPFFKQKYNIKAWMFIVPVLVFVFVYGSPRFFEIYVIEEEEYVCDMAEGDNSTSVAVANNSESVSTSGKINVTSFKDLNVENCTVKHYPAVEFKDLRKNPLYISIYANWMNLIFQILIPVGVNVTLNVYIYRAMKRFHGNGNGGAKSDDKKQSVLRRHNGQLLNGSQAHSHHHQQQHHATSTAASQGGMRRVMGNEKELKKRDAKYTRAAIVMVVAFIVCNAPRLIPNCMEILMNVQDFPEWVFVLVIVNQFLTVVNSSFNFLIYLSFCRIKKPKRKPETSKSTVLELTTVREDLRSLASNGDLSEIRDIDLVTQKHPRRQRFLSPNNRTTTRV